MGSKIFEEKQRFTQPLIWIILGVVICAITYIYIQEEEKDSIIALIGLPLIVVLLLSIRLKTRIDENGVHVQMSPFHFKPVTYKWAELYSAEVVTYSPLADYGGWGIRISMRGKGKAFNIRGNKGIRIQTADGKVRMIGTQKEVEAKEVIANYASKLK